MNISELSSSPIKRMNFALNYLGVCGSEGAGQLTPPPNQTNYPKKDAWHQYDLSLSLLIVHPEMIIQKRKCE